MSDMHHDQGAEAAVIDNPLELVRDARRKFSPEQLGLSPCPDASLEITLWLFEVIF